MIRLYTDGGARPTNPGPAGWAAAIVYPGGKIQAWSGRVEHATNNRMELHAAWAGLAALVEYGWQDWETRLIADSQYVVGGLNVWLPEWKRRGWRKSDGRKVANEELWRQIDEQVALFSNLTIEKVKGHNGDRYNEMVDELATCAALGSPVSFEQETLL